MNGDIPNPQEEDTSTDPTHRPTLPWVGPSLCEYLQFLYDVPMAGAIRKRLESPVLVETPDKQVLSYPSPVEAWRRDPCYRKWVSVIGDEMHHESTHHGKRFHVLRFLNSICEYVSSYRSFAAWYAREQAKGTVVTSWTMDQIQLCAIEISDIERTK